MTVTVRVEMHQGAIDTLLTSPSGGVSTYLLRKGILVQNAAKRLCPVDTGRLRASITIATESSSAGTIVRVGTNVEYACILGGHTPVVTDRGTRTIGQIRVGDMVMTQSGDFRAVTATHRFSVLEKPDLIEIHTPWRADRGHKLTVTLDHKMLVERDGRFKWVPAGDLLMTDRIQIRRKVAYNKASGKLKTCQFCLTEYRQTEGRGQGKKFCSQDCRDGYWSENGYPTTGTKRTPEWRAAASERNKQRLIDRPDTHPNRNQSRPSGIEETLAAWLIMRGLEVTPKPYVGQWWPDFYVESEHRIYEADGAYWHQDQSKDIARDKAILDAFPGVEIVHLHFFDKRHTPDPLDLNPLPGVWYIPVNPSPSSYVEPTVFRGVEPLELRRYRYEDVRTHPKASRVPHLYDLTIEGEHSFIAGGMLVSNSYVEKGTSRMRARPYLAPALDEVMTT